MRKLLKRAAALLLPVVITVAALHLHTGSEGLVYEGLTVAEWEAEADSLANTSVTNFYYRFGEGLRRFTGQSTRIKRFVRLTDGNDAEAIPLLTALLESPRSYARLAAVSGLRSRGLLARGALPSLRKAVGNSDEDVRHMAQQVIVNLELLEKFSAKRGGD